jgi:hypothetical protein
LSHRRVEDEIERLGRLRDPAAPETIASVRKALADRVGLVVAKAAKVAAALDLRDLLPDLLRAYDRLFEKPVERDPQCWGKNALAQALVSFDYRESAPFIRGARWVQMEPVWGGQEDTASSLRGICLLALPTCTDVRREAVFRCLVEGLTDPAQTVRIEAARAIAQMSGDEAGLLLRLKARSGEREPRVIGQVFDSLLAIEAAEAVDFVAAFLDSAAEGIAAEAALSLGASRLEAAVDALQRAWAATRDPDLRDALARALSASRQPSALAFLLDLVRNGRAAEAVAALDALAIHRESPELWRQVESAAHQGPSAVQSAFEKLS